MWSSTEYRPQQDELRGARSAAGSVHGGDLHSSDRGSQAKQLVMRRVCQSFNAIFLEPLNCNIFKIYLKSKHIHKQANRTAAG